MSRSFIPVAQVPRKRSALLVAGMIASLVLPAHGARLKPEAVAAFDRYIGATEELMANDLREGRFLVVDHLPEATRQETYTRLRQGQIYIQQLHTQPEVQAPGGLIHHWVGVTFIPGASLAQTVAVLEDYDNHKNVYTPYVRQSKLLERNGNQFKVYLQLYRKSLVTAVVDANFDIQYTLLGATRVMGKSYSTRITEVANPGKSDEHELPVGNDHGYIWRLYSYWRVEEKDSGVYIQVESVGLSRSVPWLFAWLVNPLLESIPRGVLSDLLVATRRAVTNNNPRPAGRSTSDMESPKLSRRARRRLPAVWAAVGIVRRSYHRGAGRRIRAFGGHAADLMRLHHGAAG
jgi:hypothetical protein